MHFKPHWKDTLRSGNRQRMTPKTISLEQSLETHNNKLVANILRFLTVIYTPSYDQWFKSYEFLKLTELLEFDAGQKGVTWVIRSLDHLWSGNPVNIENQYHRHFLKFPLNPYMTYSGKQNQRYNDLKAGSKRRIQQKPRNRLGSGAMVRFCLRTEIKEHFGQKWSLANDLFRLGCISKRQIVRFSFTFFGTGSVLNGRSLLNSKPTSNGTDLGKTYHTRVVDNFDTFPTSINTPIYDK
jgi:hypothetical protein